MFFASGSVLNQPLGNESSDKSEGLDCSIMVQARLVCELSTAEKP